jgi:hypothetical protein
MAPDWKHLKTWQGFSKYFDFTFDTLRQNPQGPKLELQNKLKSNFKVPVGISSAVDVYSDVLVNAGIPSN